MIVVGASDAVAFDEVFRHGYTLTQGGVDDRHDIRVDGPPAATPSYFQRGGSCVCAKMGWNERQVSVMVSCVASP